MAKHLENIRACMKDNHADALYLKSKTMKKYLQTMTGGGCRVLLTQDDGYLLLDGRYLEEAREKEKDLKIILSDDIPGDIIKILKENGLTSLALENEETSVEEYEYFKNGVDSVMLFEDEPALMRIRKDEEEIRRVQEAVDLTDEIFEKVKEKIHVCMTENEISALLQYYAIAAGAQKMSFDTIVSSGERTALPHGRPTNRRIQAHEPIMIDFGIQYNNYQSDMTRMLFIGEPNEKIRDIYNTVLKAQTTALAGIEAGKTGKEIDAIARGIITDAGYGEYFNHGLGHGIGIGDGNELPRLNQKSDMVLEDGMMMSCEPGVYVPGVGGVRIEDDVLIINGRGKALNHTPKEMCILKEEDHAV